MIGKPAARLGDAVSGGVIVQGSSSVLIGDGADGVACSVCRDQIGVGNPVNPLLGCKVLAGREELDFALPGPLPLVWQRFYSSDNARIGPLGQGWVLPSPWQLELELAACRVIDPQRRTLSFGALPPDSRRYSASEDLWLLRGGHRGDWGRRWQHLPLALRQDADCIVLGTADRSAIVFRPDPVGGWAMVAEFDQMGYQQQRHWQEGLLLAISDGLGRRYRLRYRQIVPASDHDGGLRLQSIWLEHDPAMALDQPMVLVSYDYDGAGDLVAVRDRENRTVRRFAYRDHLLVEHAVPGLPPTCYEYDRYTPTGRVIRQTNPGGLDYQFDYRRRQTVVTDSLGRQTRYEFSGEAGLCRLDRLVRPDGATLRYEYDAAGRLFAIHDVLDRTIHYRMDSEGRVLALLRPGSDGVVQEWDAEINRIVKASAPGDRVWQFRYDERGRLEAEIDPLGSVTRYVYGLERLPDRPTEIHDARGGVSRLEWNGAGLLAARTDCSGHTSRYHYDRFGYLIHEIDPLGGSTRYDYDSQGRLLRILSADGSELRLVRHQAGWVVEEQENGQTCYTAQHDLRGRVIEHGRSGMTQRYRYDAAGRLVWLCNENGAVATFAYDELDRLVEEIGFDGCSQRYRYDAAGQLLEHELPERLTRYEYDQGGRLLARHLPATGHGPAQTHRFFYNPVGQLIRTDTGRVQVEFDYDRLGRLSRETLRHCHGFEHGLRHHYDPLGNRIAIEFDDGRRLNLLHYGSGHLHQINLDGEVLLDIERDALHRETSREGFGLHQQRQYDRLGRLLDLRVTGPDGVPRAELSHRWQYNETGLLVGAGQGGRSLHYRYDKAGRLRGWRDGEREEYWRIDGAGNRLPRPLPPAPDQMQPDWSSLVRANLHNQDFNLLTAESRAYPETRPAVDAWLHNRPAFDGAVDYRYDRYGQLIERDDHGSGERLRLGYDGRGQLLCSQRLDGEGSGSTTWYDYDAFGRRVAKQTGEAITWYGWDGDQLCLIDSPTRQTRIVYPATRFGPLLRIDCPKPPRTPAWRPAKPAAAVIYLFHNDHRGMPYALSDRAGRVVWQGYADPWGQLLEEQGELAGDQPLRLPGQWHDQETGLHYNRHRYYDAASGRYITPDPIGWRGGPNGYVYTNANPLLQIDPLGLTFISAEEGQKIVDEAQNWVGTPYSLVGQQSTTEGADCSGSLYRIYNGAGFPMDYSRASDLPKNWRFKPVPEGAPLQAGDVAQWPGHVAIYDPKLNEATKGESNIWTAFRSGGRPFGKGHTRYFRSNGPLTWYRYDKDAAPPPPPVKPKSKGSCKQCK
ncbi:RHS repeat-associated core domain-containing protein [Chitinimonas lacunae]|uniref:RHS repeat-associated core domain-containing protein n=1 Tax=Chitinimonas lacunae TaxID=1963018 RepID=A0ABV8MNU5_9NEIS